MFNRKKHERLKVLTTPPHRHSHQPSFYNIIQNSLKVQWWKTLNSWFRSASEGYTLTSSTKTHQITSTSLTFLEQPLKSGVLNLVHLTPVTPDLLPVARALFPHTEDKWLDNGTMFCLIVYLLQSLASAHLHKVKNEQNMSKYKVILVNFLSADFFLSPSIFNCVYELLWRRQKAALNYLQRVSGWEVWGWLVSNRENG